MNNFYQKNYKKSIINQLASVAAMLSVFGIQSIAFAQQTAPETNKNLTEVVVTATKFPKKISEIGKVVRVISAAEIERSKGKTLYELLNEQAGIVVIGSNSNPGKDKSLSLRGAGAGYTLILMDGVPLTDPSDVAGVYDLRLLNLDQIERIEILKGGQSTLYGSDAVAGVINLITKKAGKNPVNAGLTLAAGSLSAKRVALNIDGKITKKLSYYTSYSHFETEGIAEAVDNGSDSANHGHFHRNGYIQNAVLAKLNYQPTTGITLSPYFRLSANQGTYPSDAFMDGAYVYKLRSLSGGFNSSFNIPSAGTLHVTDLYTYTQRYYNSAYGAYGYTGRFNQADVYYNQELNSHLQFIAGVSYQHAATLDSVSKTSQASLSMVSPYVSLFLKNLGGFNLDLGGRYNHHSAYDNNVTWNINPSYTIAEAVKLFVNASTAFKAPTISNLYGPFGANKSLKPEHSSTYEAGLTLFPGQNFNLDAVIYHRDIKNEITYYNNSYQNQARQNNKGIEIEPNFKPAEGLTIKGFYALVVGKVTNKAPSGRDTTYDNVIRIPKHSFGLFAGYQVNKALYMSLNFRSYQHRIDQNFADYTKIDLVNLKGYSQLDGYAEYSLFNHKLKVFAQLFNILNKRFTEVYGYSTLRFHTEIGIHLSI